MTQIGRDIQRRLFETMVRIRKAEECVVDVYAEQMMRTPTHLSIGQEAVAAGVCAALDGDDQVFCPHRCHAFYLAKGGGLNAFFAELCGKATGSNHGRGGSAHLSACEKNMYSSPILGDMIPVAVGAAFSFKMDKLPKVAVAVLGDAGLEEGVFTESLNFALLKKLPVIFVCENNLYSTHTHIRERQPASTISERVSLPEMKAEQLDGNDVEAVYEAILKAAAECRRGGGPKFFEFLTYRYREHVGPLFDYDKGYRPKKEVLRWQDKGPIKRYTEILEKRGTFSASEIAKIGEDCAETSLRAYQQALDDPWPDPAALTTDVY